MDYRKQRAKHVSINFDWAVVERAERFKFLCVHITKDLSWSSYTNRGHYNALSPSGG
jgi:hypothetical protein